MALADSRIVYILTFRTLIIRARDTAYTGENVKKAFESSGIHPLNPRTVLGKLKLEQSGESRNIARPRGYFESSPLRVIDRLKCHALRMETRNTPSPNKSKVFVDQFGGAAGGVAAGKDLNAGMLKDLRPKTRGLYPAAVRDGRQLSRARVIDSEEVVRLGDNRERVDNEKAARAFAREKKKLGTAKN